MFGKLKMPMNDMQRLSWAKTRQRGEFFFVLTRAGLGALAGVTEIFIGKRTLDPHSLTEKVITFTVMGIISGLWEWHRNEKRYAESEPAESLNIGALNGIQQFASRKSNDS